MAFTKVTNAGIGSTNTVLLHNLNVVGTVTATDGIFSGIGSFGGNVTIGGTLTYEDVTNVDAVGVITARNGISVLGAGVTIAGGGLNVTAGISTFGGNVTVGSGITLSPDGDSYFTGISTLSTLRVGSNAVTANTAGDDVVIEGSSDRGLSIISGSSSSGNIYFGDSSDADIGRIAYQHNNNQLEIRTNASADPNVLITSAGLVGIGTITPSVPLHVLSDSTGLRIQRGSESLTVNADYGGASHCALEFTSALSLFPGGGAEKIRIDSSGRVLIGTATVYAASGGGNMMVSINKSATSRTDLSISNQNTGDNAGAALVLAAHGQDFILESTGSGNSTTGAGVFTISDGASERLRIDGSGHLMIGTTTEGFATYGDQFTIANAGHCGMTIRSGTSNYGTIYFSDGDGSGDASDEVRGFVDYNHSTNKMQLGTNGSARLVLKSSGNLMIPHNHATGTSPFQHTGWYGDDANHYTLEWTDFNELYALKTHNANDYSSLIYKREYMTQYCDIEFTINGCAPSGTYRHLAFIINGDGSDTSANFDRLVFRQHTSDSGNNTTRLDKGGGGHGFTVDSTPNFLDETDHHFHIQIRKRRFTISLDGVRTVDVDTDADLVAAKGYPAFAIYEASSTNPWIKIRDFKIRNYTANAKAPSFHAGGNKFIQLSRPSGNTSETFTAQDMGMDDNEAALIHLVVSGTDLQDWGYSFFHWRMPRGSVSEIVTQITPMASGSSVATFTQAASGNSLVINKDSDLEVHLTVIGGGGRRAQVGW